MFSTRPIIVIDDDADDLEMFETAYTALGFTHELLRFSHPNDFLQFLKNTNVTPFLIFSDYNMPVLNGLELRKRLNSDPVIKFRSIPFVLWSTAATSVQVREAYDSLIQGYFVKPETMTDIGSKIRAVVEYWRLSLHPVTP